MTVDQLRALLAGNTAVAPVESAPGAVGVPDWPYTWGRALRVLSAPFDVLYRVAVTRTVVLGRDYLHDLPPVVVFAGTHHSFADVPLLRRALQRSPARRLADRLLVTAAPEGVGWESPWGRYAILAFGLYRLEPGLRREASLRQVIQLALAFGPAVHVDPDETPGAFAARLQKVCYALTRDAERSIAPADAPRRLDPRRPARSAAIHERAGLRRGGLCRPGGGAGPPPGKNRVRSR